VVRKTQWIIERKEIVTRSVANRFRIWLHLRTHSFLKDYTLLSRSKRELHSSRFIYSE